MNTLYLPEALFAHGFTDLLSVIPPGAQLAPTSKIPPAMVGKVPGRRTASGLWAGYNWRAEQATAESVRAWCLNGSSTGLRSDRFPGVDIDCLDEELSNVIRELALTKLGYAPGRIGRAPKQLLVYRTDAPFGRMRLFFEKGTERHLVEVLGMGQQYLVSGIHPKTMQPYAWDASIEEMRVDDITPITRESADAFLAELADVLELLGCEGISREGDGRPVTHSAGDQRTLAAPSIEILREAVRVIPNDFPDRTSYLKIGYAIRAAGADDLDEAFAIFHEWAMSWKGNDRFQGNDPDTVLDDWRRLKGPYSVGWPLIAELAREHGFDTASLDFDAVGTAPAQANGDHPDNSAPKYSDQWLADKVVERRRGVLRFAVQRNLFLVWDSARWQPDAELMAEDIIKQELRLTAISVLQRGVSAKEKKESTALAHALCSSGKVPAVASLVKSDRQVAVNVQSLDYDPWQLNTPAGIVDLRTGLLSAPDPDSLCTKMTAVPPDFSGDCPVWKQYLQEATAQDQDLIDYLQRLSGYALTGSTREQQFTFIFGAGGNGKGTLIGALTGILGDYAQTASMETFTASAAERHTTDLAMLAGARLVTASETESGKRWNESRLKSMTGGDMITARFMRQDNFKFEPQFKLLFIGNHKPEVRTVDDAIKRRAHMVPFTTKPKTVDQDLRDKLRAEWPAILAWMIDGCLAWQMIGLAPPKVVCETTEQYFMDEDAVGRWLQQCTDPDTEHFAGSQELFNSWAEWARRQGEYVGSLKRLSAALVSRGYERDRDPDPNSRRNGFLGVKLKTFDGLDAIL